MADSSEEFIKQHMFGNPQIKPDEKRAFLGNFRERVALALTIGQLHQAGTPELVDKVLKNYPEYRVYINGRMDQELIDPFMDIAIKEKVQFTVLVQNGMRVDQELTADDFGLVVANPTEKIKRRILL
ncbi:DUF1694 domain-containing protein [Lentilactobacillus sunkii]|uniref:DUF1694 domain-containing protein n=1 Tax=Lentilactobacillus sunkii DSM 19904 TaxID=1423808 RepID=A0A0R1KZ53_9LACO|nr:DUF1694 domain-containing protein [Lentilactobacillus sunkii]KRK88911.1 hypothetical protein FD17_GL002174 [Lentilactobacillus sunkii DSM 19904]